jgi:hypothetical protein
VPNVYTVPFLGGRLFYGVFEGPEAGLVIVLWFEA